MFFSLYGRKYVTATGTDIVGVHLPWAYGDESEFASARVAFAGVIYMHRDTGDRAYDEESGTVEHVYEWRNADTLETVDPYFATFLGAALKDVANAFEEWCAADARMGDPNP